MPGKLLTNVVCTVRNGLRGAVVGSDEPIHLNAPQSNFLDVSIPKLKADSRITWESHVNQIKGSAKLALLKGLPDEKYVHFFEGGFICASNRMGIPYNLYEEIK